MIRCIYPLDQLRHLDIIKRAKRWGKNKLIDPDQLKKIRQRYAASLYHPNLIIRLLLFIATLLALSGVTGVLGLMVFELSDEEVFIGFSCLAYGAASLIVLEQVFFKRNRHYKSGVTEGLMYHAIGFLVMGVALLSNAHVELTLISALGILLFTTLRYVDLLSCLCAMGCVVGLAFYEAERMDMVPLLPFFLILTFGILAFFLSRFRITHDREHLDPIVSVAKFSAWCMIYVSCNYYVVRELSIALMELSLDPGADIPFALVFYGLTVLVPVAYVFFGIRHKDILLLRVSLLTMAMTAFTFNYYFGFKDVEIAATLAGFVAIALSVVLIRYLKTAHGGFTSESGFATPWLDENAQAFGVSQTLGGNQQPASPSGGGTFGGGGASGEY